MCEIIMPNNINLKIDLWFNIGKIYLQFPKYSKFIFFIHELSEKIKRDCYRQEQSYVSSQNEIGLSVQKQLRNVR